MNNTNVALITGTSGGIGLELALCAARDGYAVIGVGRDKDRLERALLTIRQAGAPQTRPIVADLSNAAGVAYLLSEITDQPIDLLINNAGFGEHGQFAETSWSRQADLLGLNIVALTQITHALLPGMMARKSGHILNLGSVAAFYPGPLMATYYASKAYVVSFSEALAQEVTGTGVSVTVLCPGLTETNFVKEAKLEGSRLSVVLPMQAVDVANIGWQGMLKHKAMVVPGLQNSLATFASRLVPRPLAARMTARLNRN